MMQGAFINSGGGTGAFGRMSAGPSDGRNPKEVQTIAGGPATWTNPTGRVSVQFAPGAVSPPCPSLPFLLSFYYLPAHHDLQMSSRKSDRCFSIGFAQCLQCLACL